MDVQEAVHIAKNWVTALFKDEQVTRLGLEEVELDEEAGVWRVTVGFSREWNDELFGRKFPVPAPRAYKVITIDAASGEVESMRNRDPA
jgi:hypothetical protein